MGMAAVAGLALSLRHKANPSRRWHAHIQQNEVGPAGQRPVVPLQPVESYTQPEIRTAQRFDEQTQLVRIVFDDENVRRR